MAPYVDSALDMSSLYLLNAWWKLLSSKAVYALASEAHAIKLVRKYACMVDGELVRSRAPLIYA
jgi:hypothetical protein